jgi:hypothetical protein
MKHRVENVLVSLDHRIQATQAQAETEATKTLTDTTRRGLEAKIAEVTDDFLEGLKTARRKFKTQLEEVKARGAHEFSKYSTIKSGPSSGLAKERVPAQAWCRPLNLRTVLMCCVLMAVQDHGRT